MENLISRIENLENIVEDLSNKINSIKQPHLKNKQLHGFININNPKQFKLNMDFPLFIHNPKTGGRAFQMNFKKKINYFLHASANNIKNRLQMEFSKIFSFSFIRHPYARFLSAFYFLNKKIDPNDFCDEFAKSKLDWVLKYNVEHVEHFLSQKSFFVDYNDKIIITKLYKYEHMEDALKDLEKNGIKDATKFIVKPGKSNNWKSILNEKSLNIIKENYYMDFELYNSF